MVYLLIIKQKFTERLHKKLMCRKLRGIKITVIFESSSHL